ncbi:MAG: hypothetical protein JWO38_1336 [Gemmataceae bacterium]|nr:hypothetical protein [Gemmataceae bacterium]
MESFRRGPSVINDNTPVIPLHRALAPAERAEAKRDMSGSDEGDSWRGRPRPYVR